MLTRRSAEPEVSLRDEVRILDAKRVFEKAPTDGSAFGEYSALLRAHGQNESLEAAKKLRADALEAQRKDPVGHDHLSGPPSSPLRRAIRSSR